MVTVADDEETVGRQVYTTTTGIATVVYVIRLDARKWRKTKLGVG